MFFKRTIVLLSMMIAALFSSLLRAEEPIRVLAASSLMNVLETIRHDYNDRFPDRPVQLIFAASSTLARQIEYGAPADLFISADQTWTDRLIQQKIASRSERLLRNRLVLIAPKDHLSSPIDHLDDLTWLREQDRIAIGDPRHVPAGHYAQEALSFFKWYDALTPQFIYANSVRDALMYVSRGEADWGIVYATDAQATPEVTLIATFPESSHSSIDYPIVQLSDAADHFYHYLYSIEATQRFAEYGFLPP